MTFNVKVDIDDVNTWPKMIFNINIKTSIFASIFHTNVDCDTCSGQFNPFAALMTSYDVLDDVFRICR